MSAKELKKDSSHILGLDCHGYRGCNFGSRIGHIAVLVAVKKICNSGFLYTGKFLWTCWSNLTSCHSLKCKDGALELCHGFLRKIRKLP